METAVAAGLRKCLPTFSQDIAENLQKLSLQEPEEVESETTSSSIYDKFFEKDLNSLMCKSYQR